MSIKNKVVKGVKWTALSTIIATFTQIAKIAVLARFLSPEDFGLMALASVVVGFTQVFADGGVSNAIIYKQKISDKQLSSLYWFNVIVGFILFLVIILISPVFSHFYKEPQLLKIIPILGLTVLIQSFSFQYKALFEKELRFNTLAKIEIISKIVSLFVAVFLAYKGLGVYSLVYSMVVMVLIETVFLVYKGFYVHKPVFYFSLKEISFFIKFGLFQLGERITNYISSQLDVILIGKLLGTDTVGVYSVIKQLVMRPAYILNPIITRVTFPVMSKFQNDIKKLKDIYLKTIKYVVSVNFPVYTFMIVLAPIIIKLLLGEKWLPYTFVFQLLSVYFMFRAVGNPVGSLILARGRPDIEFYWNIVMLVYIPAWIVAGSFFGLEGVAVSLAVSHIILVFIDWLFLVKPMCRAGFIEYHREIILPLAVSLITGLFMYLPLKIINAVFVSFVFSLLLGSLFYLSLSYLFNREFTTLIKEFLK